MSLSKPVKKQSRISAKTPATTLVPALSQTPQPVLTPEGSDHHITSPLTYTTTPVPAEIRPMMIKRPMHPKGHNVRNLLDVWKNMDEKEFLHLTDTLTLGDVWVQPLSIFVTTSPCVQVTFRQLVLAPHIKYRDATCKMMIDDVAKMLYLCACLQLDMQDLPRPTFDDWIAEKTELFTKVKGIDSANNRAALCQFLIREDAGFTYYPRILKNRFGIFFRKIAYHSYKSEQTTKIMNPSMIKCSGAPKSAFEYILEARIFPLPQEWFDVMDNIPSSQDERDTMMLTQSQIF